jgi:hypothetical protein
MNSMRINMPIFGIALLYSWMETSAFGWNFFPSSTGEVLADGIACVLFAMSFAYAPRIQPDSSK